MGPVGNRSAAFDDPPAARELRRRLVGHIVAAGVRDPRVLAAMEAVPRHAFVPGHELERAYGDHPLPIGYDVTISQPSLVAIMSEALTLSGEERVLEIGTGSGYQTAVLSRLAAHVDTVEVVMELAEGASAMLRELGCSNVAVHVGDGWRGHVLGAPFDRVIVTAAPDTLPPELLGQLKDGGLLLAPVGSQASDQRLERWRKDGRQLYRQDLGAVRFVPMVHSTS